MNDLQVRLLLRFTAAVSAICFLLAFAAPAAGRVWPSRTSDRLLSQRTHLFVALAVSHTLHLALVVTRTLAGGFKLPTGAAWLVTMLGGGIAYVIIYALALSSLWPERLPWLHRLRAEGASWWVWLTFFRIYLGSARNSWWRALLVASLLAGALLRIYARFRRFRPGAATAASAG